MKQVIANAWRRRIDTCDVPVPRAGARDVVVRLANSVISVGTERSVVDLAQRSLVGKAVARPDHVRRILQKVRQEGVTRTLTQLEGKLREATPLGYSASGRVIDCGRDVQDIKVGDAVAVAGPHAAVIQIGANLCAVIPNGVNFENAAYTSI